MPTPIVFEDVAPVVPVRDLQGLWSDIVNSALRSGPTATARDTASLSGEPYQFI